MGIRKTLLGWLFEKGPEEPAEETPGEQKPEEAPESETQTRYTLELPPEHSLRKLWTMYSEQDGWQPQPEISFGTTMAEEDVRAEMMRLRIAVNSSASGRAERLRKLQGAGDEAVLPDIDAEVVVFLPKDCLAAWVLVYPPVGAGRHLDRDMLTQALDSQQVRFGVDNEMLNKLPKEVDRYFRLVPVARGKKAVDGEDGRVDDMYPRVQERKLKVDEHNRVDYTNLDFIHNVEQEGVICWIVAPTDGQPGRTVQDKEIAPKKGKTADIPKGRNTEISEDGKALIASIAGHVEYSGRGFQVKPVLDVPGNVDFSIGNINYLGDVHIHGDVCSGFTVRASGTVTVGGVVEACSVEAGKDLVLSKGVQGNGQAILRAQRSVFAKYLENSCIYAKESLETECIINCEVYCDGIVAVRTGHKSIIGGKVLAAQEVETGVAGSRVGNRTEITLGGSPCDTFDYDLLLREIAEMEGDIERTERQHDSPNKESSLAKLRVQLMLSRSKLETMQKEREEQAVDPPEPGVCRFTANAVYPGTVLTIGGQIHHFNEKMSPCKVTLQDGALHFTA